MGWWTIGRAGGVGVVAALAGLALWPAYSGAGDRVEIALLAAAAVAAFCGGSILLITLVDLVFHRRRGERLRPVRAFDLCFALVLLALAALQWADVAGSAGYVP